jgi:hypothetical protein
MGPDAVSVLRLICQTFGAKRANFAQRDAAFRK